MVRPLALWEDNPRFSDLVATEVGHAELIHSANTYRSIHQYWPSPAQVFESVLGPPTLAAKVRASKGKEAFVQQSP